MLEVMRLAVEKIQWYVGESWQYLLLLLALVFLLLDRKERENRRLFLGYSLIFALIYICPLTAKIIMDYCIGEFVYWRMLWLLPIPVILAYVCVKICRKPKKPWMQAVCMVILALAVCGSGKCVYTPRETPYVKASNPHKLPPEILAVCDVINENRAEDEEVRVAAPYALAGYMRQYDASIRLAYGRRGHRNRRIQSIYEEIEGGNPNWKNLVKQARRAYCNYLIYPTDEEEEKQLAQLGFQKIGQVAAYVVYKDTKPRE